MVKKAKNSSANFSSSRKSNLNKGSRQGKVSKKPASKTKGNQQVNHRVNEVVTYDPVHKGSSRRTRGKITKVLTGPKKSDPETKEVRYAIKNEKTGKETIYGQHSIED